MVRRQKEHQCVTVSIHYEILKEMDDLAARKHLSRSTLVTLAFMTYKDQCEKGVV